MAVKAKQSASAATMVPRGKWTERLFSETLGEIFRLHGHIEELLILDKYNLNFGDMESISIKQE